MKSQSVFAAILAFVVCQTMHFAAAEEFDLYFLGGQSNMDGYGYVNELPESLSQSMDDVLIFHGNTSPDLSPVDGQGIWAPLKPGHGVGFVSDGKQNKLSNRFGVELTFAAALLKHSNGRKIAIIKYSRGGTSIAQEGAGRFGCWEPDFNAGTGDTQGINQYDHCLATLRNAFAESDIDGDGEMDQLIPAGIVWMQGESDANDKNTAAAYESNLKRLMDLLRAALHQDDLPVVLGRISDSGQDTDGHVWDFGIEVRQAQAAFVEHDVSAAIVNSTDDYGYSDKWHYDSAGYIDLGQQFAASMRTLRE